MQYVYFGYTGFWMKRVHASHGSCADFHQIEINPKTLIVTAATRHCSNATELVFLFVDEIMHVT